MPIPARKRAPAAPVTEISPGLALGGPGANWNALGNAGGNFLAAGTGDYNGDGTDDVLWYNSANGNVGQYVMVNGQATWQPLGQGGNSRRWPAPPMPTRCWGPEAVSGIRAISEIGRLSVARWLW